MNKKIILIVFLLAVAGALVYVSYNVKKTEKEATIENTVNDNRVIANDVIAYVESNIQTIATNSPVLGGTWHTTVVNVDPYTNSGMVSYEDGHIQSQAMFKYKYTSKEKIEITEFTVKK